MLPATEISKIHISGEEKMAKNYPKTQAVEEVNDEDTFGGFMQYLCDKNNKCDAIAIIDLSDLEAEVALIYQDPRKTGSIRVGALEGLMRMTIQSAASTINDSALVKNEERRFARHGQLESMQLQLNDLIIYAKRFDSQEWRTARELVYIIIINCEDVDVSFFNVHKRTTVPLIEEALFRSKFLVE